MSVQTVGGLEVPDELTLDEFNKLEKPRFKKAKQLYKQIHDEGSLMHETE